MKWRRKTKIVSFVYVGMDRLQQVNVYAALTLPHFGPCGWTGMNHSTTVLAPGKKASLAEAVGCLLFGFLLVAAVCAWLLYTIYDVGNSLWQVYLLKSRGQPAVARVTEYTPEKRWPGGRHRPDTQLHFHTVEFDGHSGKVRLPKETPLGTEIHVLYLPEAPEVVTAGERDDSFLTLLRGRALERTAWDGLMCSLSCGWLLFVIVAIAGIEKLLRWCGKLVSR
jgi:hypothetical protein